jgi:hypothetical protein
MLSFAGIRPAPCRHVGQVQVEVDHDTLAQQPFQSSPQGSLRRGLCGPASKGLRRYGYAVSPPPQLCHRAYFSCAASSASDPPILCGIWRSSVQSVTEGPSHRPPEDEDDEPPHPNPHPGVIVCRDYSNPWQPKYTRQDGTRDGSRGRVR